jgi:lysophospholipase L1-like esterase
MPNGRASIDTLAHLRAEDAGTAPCHILAIGDSLTDTQSQGGGYLKGWRNRCPDCRFTNIGRGGAMVNQMLWRLRRHLSEFPEHYSHWVVFGGVNDLYSDVTANRTLEKIERDLTEIYQLGHTHASIVIAITVAPWGGFRRWYTEGRGSNTRSLNEWIAQAQKRGVIDIVIDAGASLSCGDPMQLCPDLMAPFRDGLHFGSEGHRRLGESLILALDGTACGTGLIPAVPAQP